MASNLSGCIRPIDEVALRATYERSDPFPFFCIDGFLEPRFAAAVAASYPDYETAAEMGRSFSAVNEDLKVQICERERFPDPVAQLDAALCSDEFLKLLERVTGIPKLLADEELVGGGMHVMGSGGRLDVHVDFNLIEERALHRRLNILVFLNNDWAENWGGKLELWDSAVRERGSEYTPAFNRCVVFETSEISYHGVTPLVCPADRVRKSFAAYYYTREAPEGWHGTRHTTRFQARPDEVLRGRLLMPAERMLRALRPALRRLKRIVLGDGGA
jgi:hypothetical protein